MQIRRKRITFTPPSLKPTHIFLFLAFLAIGGLLFMVFTADRSNDHGGIPSKNSTSRQPMSCDKKSKRRILDWKEKITKTKYPLAKDPECKDFSVNLFQNNTFEITALASQPGSGNTWLRHLMEFATGAYTGTSYTDPELRASGFVDQETSEFGGTILVKIHWNLFGIKYPRVVLLIREPYAAMLSYIRWQRGGHEGPRKPVSISRHSNVSESVLFRGVLLRITDWAVSINTWLHHTSETHVIHYENLLKNPIFEVDRLCAFLCIDCSRIHSPCFQRHMEGSFKRKKSNLLDNDLYKNEAIAGRMREVIEFIDDLLIRKGLDPLPTHMYKFYNASRKEIRTVAQNKTFYLQ